MYDYSGYGYGYDYGNGYDNLYWSADNKYIYRSHPSYFLLKTDIGTEIPLYTPTFNLVLDFSARNVHGCSEHSAKRGSRA